MRRVVKRIIGVTMTLVMITSMFPAQASATDGGDFNVSPVAEMASTELDAQIPSNDKVPADGNPISDTLASDSTGETENSAVKNAQDGNNTPTEDTENSADEIVQRDETDSQSGLVIADADIPTTNEFSESANTNKPQSDGEQIASADVEGAQGHEIERIPDDSQEMAAGHPSLMSDSLTYGNLQYIVDEDTITITGCDETVANLDIPSQIDGKQVTAIGSYAFSDHSNLVSVKFPDSLKEVGYYAFHNCANLSGEIDIPQATRYVRNNAFAECKSITSVTFHQNDTEEWVNSERVAWAGTIESNAFEGCSNLAEVTLVGSMKTIQDGVFRGCANLKELEIPEGVISLGSYVIQDTGISSITIPSTVETGSSSWNGAMAGCSSLTAVTFAPGIKKIPDYFCASDSQTSYIQTVTIPDSVEEIGYYAFYKCVNLTGGIDVPQATRYVRSNAFAECKSITSVTFHQNDTEEWVNSERVAWAGTIESNAFEDCSSLAEVTLAGSMKTIQEGVFRRCASLKELEIPEGVISLGSYVIQDTGISSITIPSTVETGSSSWNGAMAGCPALTTVTFAPGIKKIPDNFCASDSQTSYIQTVTIPDSVEEIGYYAFYKCVNLTGGIDIPQATRYVRSNAFAECKSIASVTFHQNDTEEWVNSERVAWAGTIESNAFEGCSSLAEVTLAGSMKTIQEGVFRGCANLKELEIPEGVTSLGSYVIQDTGISSITIPSTIETGSSSWNGAMAGCPALTTVTFAPGTKKIPDYFCASDSQTSYIQTVTIPDTVEEIGYYAFYKCVNLTSDIDIPQATRYVRSNAFAECKSIASVTFHQNDTEEWVNSERVAWAGTIESNAFEGCSSLAEVTLAGSMKTIQESAFSGCSSLKELAIPEGVTSLGSYVIRDTAISSITIPSTIETGSSSWNGAMAGCPALTTVTFAPGTKKIPAYFCASDSQTSYIQTIAIPDTVEEIGYHAFYKCVNIADLRLPTSLVNLSPTAFEEAVIGRMTLASEDSPAAITLIDLEIPFVAEETGIKDSSNRFLDRSRTNYYSSTSSVSAAGQIPLTVRYDFKPSGKSSATDLRMTIKIPAIESVSPNTLKVDGTLIEYEEDEGRITFPLEKTSGTITFCIAPQDTSYLMSYAQISFNLNGEWRTETVGIVNMASEVLTLYVPGETASANIVAAGVTSPGQTVSIYLEDDLLETVQASATGNYSVRFSLPSPTDGAMYKVEARSTTSTGTPTTVTDYVTYRSTAAELTQFMMYYRGNQYDLLSIGSKRPVISWASDSVFTFVVDFDDCSKVNEVRIVSSKGNEDNILQAVYDERGDRFVASGFAGYVPGTISVQYSEEHQSMFDGASVRFDKKSNVGDTSANRQFYIDQGIDGSNFYYFTEYEANAAFDYSARNYTQGTYHGKACYVTIEPFEYEKDSGCFFAKEIYVKESDGSYTMVRTGIGLYADASLNQQSGEATLQGRNSELQEIWEQTEKLLTVLTDEKAKKDEVAVYGAVYAYIDEAKKHANSTDLQELNEIEEELKLIQSLGNWAGLIDEAKSVSNKAFQLADDPAILLPDKVESEMDNCFDAMRSVAKDVENKHLRNALKRLFDKGWFGKDESLIERIGKQMDDEYKTSNATFRGNWAIDPSGYVYEAVESNRISGVTATIYYRETMDSTAVIWDADEYDQLNPLSTDEDGCYAWDVPEGFWQVRYEKDGYETASSEWLPVPPPQLDVNVGIIAQATPNIQFINAYADAIEVVFSQYVDVNTVNSTNVKFEEAESAIAGQWNAIDSEQSPSDASVTLATTFRFIPESELTSSAIACTVNGIRNYAGREMVSGYSESIPVTLDIKSVQVDANIEIAYQESKSITITATPPAAAVGKHVYLTCGDSFTLSLDDTAVFNQNGSATFNVTSLLPGKATVSYSIEGTSHTGTITVTSSEIYENSEEPDITLGDVNSDDEVDANDLAIIINHIVNHVAINGDAAKAADVNGDNEIDANDLAVLINYIVNHVPIPKK